jgi:arylsulfatase A-like enzyme
LPSHAAAAELTDGEERPNFVLVTIDDAAPEDFSYMPYTQRLIVDEGVELTNFVAPTPICVPSRTSTLTGTYAHNHGNVTIGGPHGSAQYFEESGANLDTLSVWLDSAGYETYLTGKWMNGFSGNVPAGHVEPGWDRWEPLAKNTYNFFRAAFWNGDGYSGTNTYSTYQITDRATEFIEDGAATPDPWFAWVNYVAPHVGRPLQGDDPEVLHRGKVDLKTTVPAPIDRNTFRDLSLRDQPNMWATGPDTFTSGISPTALEKQSSVEVFQQRIEALQAVDRGLEALVRSLSDTGQLDNTYIIVTSDNGYATGEHNIVGKLWFYRDIIGLPAAIRGPGIEPGTVAPSLASVVDLGPTIAAWAGAPYPAGDIDGTDFSGMLSSSSPLRRAIPISGYRMETATDELAYWGVLYDQWTYVSLVRSQREELYDNVTDPFQMNNLATDPTHLNELIWLRQMAEQYRDCAGDSCPKTYS